LRRHRWGKSKGGKIAKNRVTGPDRRERGRGGEEEMGRRGEGEMGRWGEEEKKRWGEEEKGRWGDGKRYEARDLVTKTP
jgi:hypothetical protein